MLLGSTWGFVDRDFAPFALPWFLQHIDRVPTLLHALLNQLLLGSNWGFVWVLVAAAALMLPPLRDAGRAFLLWLVAVHLLALTIIFTFSMWDHTWTMLGRRSTGLCSRSCH
jgi:hypothetical protein